MYFNRAVSDDEAVINGGHIAFGSDPAAVWNFGEGTVLPEFAMYITVGNPDPANAATAVIEYFFSDGDMATRSLVVPAGSRRTVQVFNAASEGGVGRAVGQAGDRGVSFRVRTAAAGGIVVERPQYFHRVIVSGTPEINGGHNTPGAQDLAQSWAFAEGSTLPGFFPFLTVLNPNAVPVTLAVTYTPDTGGAITRVVEALPNSRLTLQAFGNADVGGVGDELTGFGITVSASAPVLVERPFYADRVLPTAGAINGGDVVIGLPF